MERNLVLLLLLSCRNTLFLWHHGSLIISVLQKPEQVFLAPLLQLPSRTGGDTSPCVWLVSVQSKRVRCESDVSQEGNKDVPGILILLKTVGTSPSWKAESNRLLTEAHSRFYSSHFGKKMVSSPLRSGCKRFNFLCIQCLQIGQRFREAPPGWTSFFFVRNLWKGLASFCKRPALRKCWNRLSLLSAVVVLFIRVSFDLFVLSLDRISPQSSIHHENNPWGKLVAQSTECTHGMWPSQCGAPQWCTAMHHAIYLGWTKMNGLSESGSAPTSLQEVGFSVSARRRNQRALL